MISEEKNDYPNGFIKYILFRKKIIVARKKPFAEKEVINCYNPLILQASLMSIWPTEVQTLFMKRLYSHDVILQYAWLCETVEVQHCALSIPLQAAASSMSHRDKISVCKFLKLKM